MPRYFTPRGTDPEASPVYVVEDDAWWSIPWQGEASRSHDGALPEFIAEKVAEMDPAEGARLIEARVAVLRQQKAEADRVARESAARFRLRRAIMIAALVVLLLAVAGLVVGYCGVGVIQVQGKDLASATVMVSHGPGPPVTNLDLTDRAMRQELARLLSGLHRWWKAEPECTPAVTLEVTLRDGLKYHVGLYPDYGGLTLEIDRGGPEEEAARMWVRSGEMGRFLAQFLGEPAGG